MACSSEVFCKHLTYCCLQLKVDVTARSTILQARAHCEMLR
jgi:hypothetical protein